jgi:demethylmenaquinone methyltransferase/2-methoxy-6-polyprenyl-1,4-benzoquinol methylase
MKPVQFYKKFVKEYDARDLYNLPYAKWLFANIIKQINKEKATILDLGTGTGELAIRIAKKFPKSEVIGNDISQDMIDEAKRKAGRMGIKNIKFVVCPMEKLDVKKIDFAVSRLAFHYCKDKKLIVSKIYDALTKNGRLIIGDGFHQNEEYTKEVEKMRSKHLKKAKEFDESYQESVRRTSKKYLKFLPKDYPISASDLKNIMKNVGFERRKIIKSLIPKFSVVIGEK